MFSKNELLDAIEELEMSPATYQNAEKLATFYLLYDHLYIKKEPVSCVEKTEEVIIEEYGGSEFLQTVAGNEAAVVWPILDEMMEAVKVLQPRLYNAAIDKLKGG